MMDKAELPWNCAGDESKTDSAQTLAGGFGLKMPCALHINTRQAAL
jgi:hypothetical protein